MYKDKEKQREADRERQRRYRANATIINRVVRKHFIEPKGVTGCDKKGVTNQSVTEDVTVIPNLKTPAVTEFTKTKFKPERTERGNIRVSKPGDLDHVPQCETTRAFIEDRPKRPETGKRGKDIKCFEDLPPDVQKTINRMSINKDGTVNQTVKVNRTAIAIHYQHLFPGRYYSTGTSL